MDLLRDVRLTVRYLLKAPGYTAAAVVTLALAIGANAAIFGAVQAVLLRPLPIRQANNLVVAWETDTSRNLPVVEVTYRNFQRWQSQSKSFEQMTAMGSSTWPTVLEGRGEAAKVSLVGVSWSFFDTLGAQPLLGRAFRPEDDQPNAARMIVLNYGTWVRRFSGNPAVLGTIATFDKKPYTIVGVMPQGFDFPRGAEFWTPVVPVIVDGSAQWQTDGLENVGVLFVIGRLREGVTAEMAAAELDGIARRVPGTRERPASPAAVTVTPLLTYLLGPVRAALWWLFAAVGVLLVIACANVSGLMLTRVTLQRREQAIRLALGASRIDTGRLWTIEIVVLSLVAGTIGLAASRWIVAAIVALAPDDAPRLADISINRTVAGFTFLVVLATALLCGAGPVLQASTASVVSDLNDSARGTGSKRSLRARSLLVTLQIALAVVLLVAAGLVVRSFTQLRQIDLGFDPEGVLTMDIEPRLPKPPANEWLYELLTRIETLPQVEAAGSVYLRPLALGAIGQEVSVMLEGQTLESVMGNPLLNYESATPGYFGTMQIALKRGRLFTSKDDQRAPRVVVLGESAARRLWPGQDPIGRRVSLPQLRPDDKGDLWRTVIGVVGDVRYRGLDDVRLDLYDAALQSPMVANHVVVRASGDLLTLAAAISREARRLDPDALVGGITTMEAIVSRAMAPWRFSMWMFTLFSTFAFVLAVVGLFSIVSLDIAQRSREFAVRVAVGAQSRDIYRRVLGLAGRRTMLGVLVGMLLAVAGTRSIESILFGIDPLDPYTYTVVVVLVVSVMAAASYLPARRAAGIDPVVLLKRE